MKTKKIIFTFALLFITFLTSAQNKYQFMVIIYRPFLSDITISLDGKKLIKEDVILEGDEKARQNANPLLKKISEYQDQNWEVVSINVFSEGQNGSTEYNGILRKKKEDKK